MLQNNVRIGGVYLTKVGRTYTRVIVSGLLPVQGKPARYRLAREDSGKPLPKLRPASALHPLEAWFVCHNGANPVAGPYDTQVEAECVLSLAALMLDVERTTLSVRSVDGAMAQSIAAHNATLKPRAS